MVQITYFYLAVIVLSIGTVASYLIPLPRSTRPPPPTAGRRTDGGGMSLRLQFKSVRQRRRRPRSANQESSL